jgi:predicted RNA binding protein YcfA (HicA-like mRNA interferase family)
VNARRLPVVSGKEMVRLLETVGFKVVRIKGSHHMLRHITDTTRKATVPVHSNEDLRPGTLRQILQQAGISVDDFDSLL